MRSLVAHGVNSEFGVFPVFDSGIVPNRPGGQAFCLDRDSTFVPRRCKSLFFNGRRDNDIVSHQEWCGTKVLSNERKSVSRLGQNNLSTGETLRQMICVRLAIPYGQTNQPSIKAFGNGGLSFPIGRDFGRGDRGGRRTGSTPSFSKMVRNAAQNLSSRSISR
jgi:hypothetical protein